jgi:beta-glucosidase
MFLLCVGIYSIAQSSADYKNPKLSTEKRIADLLKRMSVEEKVAQLQSTHAGRPKLTDDFFGNTRKIDSMYGNGMGMINPDFDATMEQTIDRRNKLQQYMRTKTRLGIPILFIDEAHHGLTAPGADVFPTSIGFACSWDTALMTRVYTAIANEANSKGTNLVLAPVIDVTRDPRWGRTGETWGEDPFLSGIFGSAVVKGYQGSSNGQIMPGHVAATLKHFTGHGQSEAGINQGPANYSERVLREFHMEPFRICIERAKPAGLMASYCEIDGIPSHANSWLLKDVLRKEWSYNGIVVSDWFGIDQLWKKHFIEPTEKDAAARAFNAGVTVDLPYGINYIHLVQLVKDKKISMANLDKAVSYVLRLKFEMGLFERPAIDIDKARQLSADKSRRALALKAAESSMVLLKNQNNLLPIKQGQYKKIAVVGPCAYANFLGDYSGIPTKNVSVLQGIKNKAIGSEILYAKGCNLSLNGDTVSINNFQYTDKIVLPGATENQQLIDEAFKTASKADLIIVAVGENEQFSREGWTPNHWGDMSDLNLQSQQEALVKAMMATGKPVVVYLAHARPLSINWIAANVPAIVDGWYMGEEAGNAFANILFGDVNPSGKLTISVPKGVGQLPIFYNHKPSAKYMEYVTEKPVPLYPFGFGLSYTSFWCDPIIINGRVVSVNVTNTGKVKGEEIVQMYIRDKVSSLTRPVKELKGFQKISLNPGETKTVSFTITDDLLRFWDKDMRYVVEPGDFDIMIGPSSEQWQKITLTIK